jgi:hypothetical protein
MSYSVRSKLRHVASLRSVLTLLAAALCIAAAQTRAAGQPNAAFLEGKFHMLITGLRAVELSRVTGNELYAEHGRDVRAIPGLLRYTQNVPLSMYDLRSSFDSISELQFEDFEHAKVAFAADATRLGAFTWMSRFTGGPTAGLRPWRPSSNGMVIVKDHVIVDGHEQGYKWFSFMRRKAGVSKADADTYMRAHYARALGKLPGIRRYVLGLTYRPVGADAAGGIWGPPQKWDAIDMVWFDSLEAMMRLLGSADYQENALRPAEDAVMDASQTVSFAAASTERIPFPPRYDGPSWEEMRPASAGMGQP